MTTDPCLGANDTPAKHHPSFYERRRDWFKIILGSMVTIGFFGVIFVLIRYPLPEGQVGLKEALLILLGTLGAKFGTVVDYVFGGSQGSEDTKKLFTGKTL